MPTMTTPTSTSAGPGSPTTTGDASTTSPSSTSPLPNDAGTTPVTERSPTAADRPELLGEFDLWLDDIPTVEGCEPLWTNTHSNVHLFDEEGLLSGRAFADWGWHATETVSALTLDTTTVELPETVWRDRLTRPAIRLELDDAGWTGTGQLNMPYSCEGNGDVEPIWIPIRLATDETAPQLRANPMSPGPVVFPFTNFGFTFSEPVLMPNGVYEQTLQDLDAAASSVEFIDGGGQTVPVEFLFALGGPVATARFVEPAAATGRLLSLAVAPQYTDRAGNVAVAEGTQFDVLPAAVADPALDFDVTLADGIYGTARFATNGPDESLCEAGSCLVFEGQLPRCEDNEYTVTPEFPLLAVELRDAPASGQLQIRLRLFADDDATPWVRIFFSSGCIGDFGVPTMTALETPQELLTRATAWNDELLGLCGGPVRESGFALSVGCREQSPTGRYRVVIESIVPKPE